MEKHIFEDIHIYIKYFEEDIYMHKNGIYIKYIFEKYIQDIQASIHFSYFTWKNIFLKLIYIRIKYFEEDIYIYKMGYIYNIFFEEIHSGHAGEAFISVIESRRDNKMSFLGRKKMSVPEKKKMLFAGRKEYCAQRIIFRIPSKLKGIQS